MDVADLGVPAAVAFPVRLVFVEAGELRLQPTVFREGLGGFHPVEFHVPP